MDIGFIILIGLLLAGLGYFFYSKNKNKTKDKPEGKSYLEVIANLQAQGKVQDRDFKVFIIGKKEFEAKRDKIDNWLRSEFTDKTGTIPPYDYKGQGLHELRYITNDKEWDILLLIADKDDPVIDVPLEEELIKEWPDPVILKNNPKETLEVFYVDTLDAINDVPDGTEQRPNIVIPPFGDIYREETWSLYQKKHLIIAGNTTIVSKTPNTDYFSKISDNTHSKKRHILFHLCHNIKMSGVNVLGSNLIEGLKLGTAPEFTPEFWKGGPDTGTLPGFPAYHEPWEAEHGIDVRDSKYILVENCNIKGVWGDGFYVGNHSGSEHITFRNSTMEFCGRSGLVGAAGKHILFENITQNKIRRSAFNCEPHNADIKMEYVKVRNCNLDARQVIFAGTGTSIVSNVWLENNTVRGTVFLTCGDTKERFRRSNWMVKNNTRLGSYGSKHASIRFTMTDNVVLIGNTDHVNDDQGRKAIALDNCGGKVIIKENNFGGAKYILTVGETPEIIYEGNTPEQLEIIHIDLSKPEPDIPPVVNPTPTLHTIHLIDDGTDQTLSVRKQIAEAPHGTEEKNVMVLFLGKAKINRVLSEEIQIILPIENRRFTHFTGGEFYSTDEGFTVGDKIIRSPVIELKNCQNVAFTDIKYTGSHNTLREDTGFPEFHGSREFDHFIDINGSQNVFLKNLKVSNIFGDFVYFRRGFPRNNFITIIDCEVHFNGRQGVAWGDGDNIYIDGLKVSLSGRGGADFEPPTEYHEAKNIIIKNSHFKTWLLPFPMGGRGIVENVLLENNTTETNRTMTSILGDRVSSFRKNIILRGNKALWGFGSSKSQYTIVGAENIWIEKEQTVISDRRSLEAIYLGNCRGSILINMNDFVNAKYIVLSDTPKEIVKVYGNNQELQFMIYTYSMPWIDPPYIFADKYKRRDGNPDSQLWKEDLLVWEKYMEERTLTGYIEYVDVEEYDVEKYGIPEIHKDPDFIPYMGF